MELIEAFKGRFWIMQLTNYRMKYGLEEWQMLHLSVFQESDCVNHFIDSILGFDLGHSNSQLENTPNLIHISLLWHIS